MDSSRGGPRSVVLLGSTGSIGTQAADVIRRNPDRFRIAGLAAGGGNPGLLASQAIEFGAEVVAVEREQAAAAVSEALRAQGPTRTRRFSPGRTVWPRPPPGPVTWCSTR